MIIKYKHLRGNAQSVAYTVRGRDRSLGPRAAKASQEMGVIEHSLSPEDVLGEVGKR